MAYNSTDNAQGWPEWVPGERAYRVRQVNLAEWEVLKRSVVIGTFADRESAEGHRAAQEARPDYNPRVDWPERYSDGRPI